jgi:hypothetical protein
MGWLGKDLLEAGEECVHLRQRRRYENPDVLAFATKGVGESQAAAEGVAVRVFVAEDQDLLVRVDEVFDLVVKVRPVAFRGGYGFGS